MGRPGPETLAPWRAAEQVADTEYIGRCGYKEEDIAAVIYRADQVGSLIRPPALLDAREAFKAGRIDRNELRRTEDEAVLDALAVQKRAGMVICTDGEMRRDA